jgi:hypothetical protein
MIPNVLSTIPILGVEGWTLTFYIMLSVRIHLGRNAGLIKFVESTRHYRHAAARMLATCLSNVSDLPQLVVCGDKSSGKSSVLEAVSGIPFPRKDKLCTRFATEVILQRFQDESATISIAPAPDRPEEDMKRLLDFQRHDARLEEL